MAGGIITHNHIKYIVVRYHIEKVKITDILAELMAERIEGEDVNEYGVKFIANLSKPYFYKRVHRIDQETIDMVKEEWMSDLLTEPLAIKKVRIKALSQLYNDETDSKTKASFLKNIREEVGETDWQEALKESGPNVTVAAGLSIGMIKQIAASVLEDEYETVDEDAE